MNLDSTVADWYNRNAPGEDDHYTQAGWLFNKAMNEQDRKNLIANIIDAMSGITGPKRDLIINRQLCHFFRADEKLGIGVAQGLGVDLNSIMNELKAAPQHA